MTRLLIKYPEGEAVINGKHLGISNHDLAQFFLLVLDGKVEDWEVRATVTKEGNLKDLCE